MNDLRKDCPMRHPDNGNCTVAGGFCTAVNDPICEALHNAFRCGQEDERDRTVLNLAEISEKYARKNLETLQKIHEKVTAEEAEPKWISVEERLPEKEGRYLCVVRIGKSGAVYVRVMNGDSYGFSLDHIYDDDVTHWMPLPEPPKGE